MSIETEANGSLPRSCEVLIIGAGPAGMAAALAQTDGRQVLLVDARRAPWRKPCDGILTPASLRLLAACDAEPQGKLHLEPARQIRVIDRDNRQESLIPLTGHLMVDRLEFDGFLRQKVTALANTLFRDHTRALGWESQARRTSVHLLYEGRNVEILADQVVDATGAFGISKRLSGAPLLTVVAVQLWFPPQNESERCDWIFDRSLTPYYAWAIRKPAGLVLGCVFPPEQARSAVRLVLAHLPGLLGVQGKPWRTQVARMALPRSAQDICLQVGPFMAVGEAAGLVNAGTGEGISFALRSGHACGTGIASAGPGQKAAVRWYGELAAGLVHEAEIKARHAELLFDPARRSRLHADDWLVPIERSRFQQVK